MIPFSPPNIREEAIEEVVKTLRSGWITTGPKTKLFEKKITEFCGCKDVLCVNSATFGLECVLRWFGVGPGDEVIVPAYTYAASVNVIIHTGATPVLADITEDDFCINTRKLKELISSRTKAIIPVDIGGLPCDYDAIYNIILGKEIRDLFRPKNEIQSMLGRILILADAAHSLGGNYKGKEVGSLADFTVFSFHAVKNLTTAEGAAIAINLPPNFDSKFVYRLLNIDSLHGQTKDALEKTNTNGWQYDIIMPGYKGNMTDIQSSLGLVGLKYYRTETLLRRKEIFNLYSNELKTKSWAILPTFADKKRESSYHLFLLRIKGIERSVRDLIIQDIVKLGVMVNVHYQPIPLLSCYKELGYKMEEYPISSGNFENEISLPVYETLTNDDVNTVLNTIIGTIDKYVKI